MPDWLALVHTHLPPVTGEFARDEEIYEELAAHMADRYDDLRASGVSAEPARQQALAELLGTTAAAADLRRAARRRAGERPASPARAITLWTEFRQNVRQAARLFRRSPGFSAATVLTLALGIGATTAIFSVVHAVLLRPLPYPDAERLVRLSEISPQGATDSPVSSGNYLDWRERAQSFSAIGAFRGSFGLALSGDGDPTQVTAAQIAPGTLRVLGVGAAWGRPFDERDAEPGTAPVALVSAGFWQQRFGAERDPANRRLILGGTPTEIVGVMPAAFEFPAPAVQIWLPASFGERARQERRAHSWEVVARLRPGVSVAQAQAEMRALSTAIALEHPADAGGWSVNVAPFREDLVSGVRPLLLVLIGVVVAVLLIACANLANLQLARTTGRAPEMAVRAALGAGRWHLARQLLTETLLLASGGGALAVATLALTLRTLIAAAPADIPLLAHARLDWTVLACALIVTLASALLVGVASALRVARGDLNPALHGAHSHGETSYLRLRNSLLVTQVALSLALLIGAGLLVQSFRSLHRVDYGFEPGNLLAVGLDLPRASYPTNADQVRFYEEALSRVRALPGVVAAAATSEPPIAGYAQTFSFAIEGRPARNPSGREDPVHLRAVSPGYLATLRQPLLRGRDIAAADGATAPPVIVISQALAARYWRDQDPLGQRISFVGSGGPWIEIVGVAGDTRHFGLGQPAEPALYLPFAQKRENWGWLSWQTLMVRAAPGQDHAALVAAIRTTVTSLDHALPLQSVTTVPELYAQSNAQRRFAMQLMVGFSLLALALGAIGIYGVVSYSVAQRRREIGVRMALGARPAQVGVVVMRRALGLALAGIAAGIAAASLGTRFLESLLFGVGATDVRIFAAMSTLLLAVGAVAAWLPARRAMRVDPVRALRAE